MNRLLHVAVREYLESVKTKAFLLAVFMTPLLMGLTFLIPAITTSQKPGQRKLALVDLTGVLGADLGRALTELPPHEGETKPPYAVEQVDLGSDDPEARAARAQQEREGLDRRVKEGEIFAYVVLRRSALERGGTDDPSEYRAGNLFDTSVMTHVHEALRKIVNDRVIAEKAVPADVAEVLTSALRLQASSVLAKTGGGTLAAVVTPLAFTLLLFLMIVSVSQALITSTLEEKGNRVIEVLLSSVSPFQLMTGKILGTCAVGLTLMAIWSAGGLAALAAQGLHLVDTRLLALCLVYYLLGFVLVASMMAAVGSACNTLKEAQNLLSPLMVMLFLPLLFWIAVGKNPNGTLAIVLSFIPLFTPFVMMMRVGATPPPATAEIVASIVVLAVSTWIALRIAARVFRIGVLLYGKPPSIREIFRWMSVKT